MGRQSTNSRDNRMAFDDGSDGITKVWLDGYRCGSIRKDADGFRYYPQPWNRKFAGKAFATLEACKESLETPEG